MSEERKPEADTPTPEERRRARKQSLLIAIALIAGLVALVAANM